jgi:HEAT repeat protein
LPLLKDGTNFQKRNVVLALGRVGKPAVPHLIDALKDGDNFVRSSAVVALQQIGPDAKKASPVLADIVMQDGNVFTRGSAIRALGMIDPDKLSDVFAKVKKHNDEKFRQVAYSALAGASTKFGPKGAAPAPAKTTVPLLIDATKDSSANVRVVALRGLAGFGAEAKDAVPAVTALLEDPNANVRSQAQVTLKQIK